MIYKDEDERILYMRIQRATKIKVDRLTRLAIKKIMKVELLLEIAEFRDGINMINNRLIIAIAREASPLIRQRS